MKFRNWVLQNFPILEDDFDALTDYELFSKMCEFIIGYSKDNEEMKSQVATLTEAFNNLKNYVDDYFDNLDVQEEINNKLDELVEDGTLPDIIDSYLNSIAIFCFDTVSDMKSSINLVNGSYAKTLGYHSINDGGSGLYKIRNKNVSDVINEGDLIEISETLVAELTPNNSVTFEMFGAYGDGETDDITYINNCIDYAITNKIEIKLLSKTYYISEPIDLEYPRDLRITGTGGAFTGSSIIKSDTICLKWCGARKCTIKGVYFIGTIGIQFYENDVTTQDSRTYNCIINDCIFKCSTSGIDVETLNGYMYIEHNTFRILERGIGLGINYTNETGVTAPNYFYINENNFLNDSEMTTETTKAIVFEYATYVFINGNDIVTKNGLDFSNMTHVCSNIRVINNSFFDNEYAIKADTNQYALREILFVGNSVRLIDGTHGIDVSNSNNQMFNFTGNYFEARALTIVPVSIIKFNSTSTYPHTFENNTPPNLSNANLWELCTFPSSIIRKISQFYLQYISLTAGASNTYNLGSKYSWIKNRFAQCTNDSITIAQTANNDGSISITATNNTESPQKGILITSY